MPEVGWERPWYQAGGGDALGVVVIFGNFKPHLDLRPKDYGATGMAGLSIRRINRKSKDWPFFATEGIFAEVLAQDPELDAAVRGASECWLLRGDFSDPKDLGYLKEAIAWATAALEEGGVGVLDVMSFQWWTPDGWAEKVYDVEEAPVKALVSVFSSDLGNGTLWIHTRGMRWFGRPDIGIKGVLPNLVQPFVALVDRLVVSQALGGRVPDGWAVEQAGIPAGLAAFEEGDLDDPNFNNVHLEVRGLVGRIEA